MKQLKKLPSSEFELMKIIWKCEHPISTNEISKHLNNDWKPQTVLTLLKRLVEKGFLESHREGKDRLYSPLIVEEEYLQFETTDFVERFHNNSLKGLVNTLYDGKQLSNDDIDELENWLKDRK